MKPADYLRAHGWRIVRSNGRLCWRHRALRSAWPTGDALRLQREADAGEAVAVRLLGGYGVWKQ